MSHTDDLTKAIEAGLIRFDPPASRAERLQKELLGENTGSKVTGDLQLLVLELSKLQKIQISSIIRDEGHHRSGRAVDIGNEAIAVDLLKTAASADKVAEWRIDEIIFDANVAGKPDRNEWNYDRGAKHTYDSATLDQHKDHIHFAVLAPAAELPHQPDAVRQPARPA